MDTKMKIVFLDTRTKVRNEAMPLFAWILIVVIVDSLLLGLGVHPILAFLPMLIIAIVKFQRRKNPNY